MDKNSIIQTQIALFTFDSLGPKRKTNKQNLNWSPQCCMTEENTAVTKFHFELVSHSRKAKVTLHHYRTTTVQLGSKYFWLFFFGLSAVYWVVGVVTFSWYSDQFPIVLIISIFKCYLCKSNTPVDSILLQALPHTWHWNRKLFLFKAAHILISFTSDWWFPILLFNYCSGVSLCLSALSVSTLFFQTLPTKYHIFLKAWKTFQKYEVVLSATWLCWIKLTVVYTHQVARNMISNGCVNILYV